MSKYLFGSAFLFAFLLPFSTKLGNISLILTLMVTIFTVIVERQYKRIQGRELFLYSTVLFFMLPVYGLFFTDFFGEAVKVLGRYVSYLLVPVFFSFLPLDRLLSVYKGGLKGLQTGVLAASGFLIFLNLKNYFLDKGRFIIDTDLLNYYHTYHHFTEPLQMHPTYFGMYVFLASVVWTKTFMDSKSFKKGISFFALLLLWITVVFLNSRVILLLTGILIAYFAIMELCKLYKVNKVWFTALIFFLGVLVGVFVFSVRNTYLALRITQELEWELSEEVGTYYNSAGKGDSRVARWKVVVKAWEDRWITGYGTAEEKRILHDYFISEGLEDTAGRMYDTHNQYLSYAIEYGVLGVILFILFLTGNIVFSWKRRNVPAFFFFIGIMIISVFENIMKNNAGIIFIAFFGTIFLLYNRNKYEGS